MNIEIEEKNPTKEHERADIGMGFLLIEIDFFPLVEKLLTLKSCSHHELLKKNVWGWLADSLNVAGGKGFVGDLWNSIII